MSRKPKPTVETLMAALDQYEKKFVAIDHFLIYVKGCKEKLKHSRAIMEDAKAAYEDARAVVRRLTDEVDGGKDGLYQLLAPGAGEFMPLFDRMEPADEEKHGEDAGEWRKDPLAKLGLSAAAAMLLHEADIVCIGQLQDRIIADPDEWWQQIEGLTPPVAAAVADQLQEFIDDKGGDK